MSPDSYQLFTVWFPAVVVALLIGLLASALWDILRRKFWFLVSWFFPGVIEEVGLDNSCPSRTEVEEKLRVVTEMLSGLVEIGRTLVPKSSNSSVFPISGVTNDFDVEAQIEISPSDTKHPNPTFAFLAYFPDGTPILVVDRTKFFVKRHARGITKRYRSSIILQASLPIDPRVLAEIGELAKDCMRAENRCTFQLGNWAILYYSAGEVHLRLLKEGDVPVNVEARWHGNGTGITMRGLFLNGSQVKVATKRTSTIFRSAGPAAQGPGDLDELHFPIEELDVPGDDALIYAAKVVEADGISLIVRSEASYILPPGEMSLREVTWGLVRRISLSAKWVIKSLLNVEDRQLDSTSGGPNLEFNSAHFELLAEHWKGVSEIELLDIRKRVLYCLRDLASSEILECAGPQYFFSRVFIRDQSYSEYWHRGLRELNDVIHWNMNGPQYGAHISIQGGIKFMLGDFEGALQDFDVAYSLDTVHRSTVLLDRALVKCMLARYSEAMQDIFAVIAINPNLNNIEELQTRVQQILYQLSFRRVQLTYGAFSQRPQLSDQQNSVPISPDLLTGDEWSSGERMPICTISDDTTAGDSKVGLPSIDSSTSPVHSLLPPECSSQLRLFLKRRNQMLEDSLNQMINTENGDLSHHSISSLPVPLLREFLDMMLSLALEMSKGIAHLDLNATSIRRWVDSYPLDQKVTGCTPYPTAELLPSTVWRLPEYRFSAKCDVYSFAVMCSQIVTGETPFKEYHGVYERGLSGVRPTLPSDLNSDLKMLIENCWHDDPWLRPDFTYVCKELRRIRMKLGTICDELENADHDSNQVHYDRPLVHYDRDQIH